MEKKGRVPTDMFDVGSWPNSDLSISWVRCIIGIITLFIGNDCSPAWWVDVRVSEFD